MSEHEDDERDEPKEGVTYYTTLAEIFYEMSGGAVGTAPRPLSEQKRQQLLNLDEPEHS